MKNKDLEILRLKNEKFALTEQVKTLEDCLEKIKEAKSHVYTSFRAGVGIERGRFRYKEFLQNGKND